MKTYSELVNSAKELFQEKGELSDPTVATALKNYSDQINKVIQLYGAPANPQNSARSDRIKVVLEILAHCNLIDKGEATEKLFLQAQGLISMHAYLCNDKFIKFQQFFLNAQIFFLERENSYLKGQKSTLQQRDATSAKALIDSRRRSAPTSPSGSKFDETFSGLQAALTTLTSTTTSKRPSTAP